MTSYLRSLFGVGPPKTHHRTNSTPTPPPIPNEKSSSYVYIKSSPSPKPRSRSRTSSYSSSRAATPQPSPLRYTTFEPASAHGHSSRERQSSERGRVPLYRARTTSHKRESAPNYPIYAPRVSNSSSRSNSSSSVRPASSHGHGPPRTSSTGSVSSTAPRPRRPVLKQNHTWAGQPKHNPNAHVTFQNPSRVDTLHMHPLLASSRQTHAPISYDVTYPPTSRTVVDRSTQVSVPSEMLLQPATDPSKLSTLVLTSDKFPWPVIVHSSTAAVPKAPTFYLGGSSQASPSSTKACSATPVTNLDVLQALHDTLAVRVTQEEWDDLGSGSSRQKRVYKAYEARCGKMGGGWKGGVRRIDWLADKTRLTGVEVDKKVKGGGAARLVFGRT